MSYHCFVDGCEEPPCANTGWGWAVCNTHSYSEAYMDKIEESKSGRRAWTAAEVENVLCYGLCLACREPRFARRVETVVHHGEFASTEVSQELVCPHGHDQNQWMEFETKSIEEEDA